MKKRLLSALLVLCMVVALLPLNAYAASSEQVPYAVEGGNIYFSEGQIVGCDKGVTKAVIPEEINGKSVQHIWNGAFEDCTNLISVTLPSSIQHIWHWSFHNCTGLTDINIPNGSVSQWAFVGCTGLTNVTFSDKVTYIGPEAFKDCVNLKSVNIPAKVSNLGYGAFSGCAKLTDIIVDENNSKYSSVDGIVLSKDKTELIMYPAGRTQAIFPSAVTRIGHDSFKGCISLESINIPGAITSMGEAIFEQCTGLKSATFSNTINSIGRNMFSGCTSLEYIAIPASVTSIEYGAFQGCSKLTDVYYAGTEAEWNKLVIGDGNDQLTSAAVHFNSSKLDNPSVNQLTNEEYIYDVPDPGDEMILPVDRLDKVTDPASAASAVKSLTDSMTSEQKKAPTCVGLATLYAENAVAKAASKAVNQDEIIISAATVADVEKIAVQSSQLVEGALSSGGVTAVRDLAAMVTLTTDAAGEFTIRVEPDILTTGVDKVCISAPTFALVLDVAELEEVLTGDFVFTAEDVGTGFGPVTPYGGMVTVDLRLPKTTTITVALPTTSGKTTYQTVVNTEGTATASKYNPATTKIEGKVNTSGKYTVTTNEVNFSDISSKSAEMQKAIRYLASKGIINGTSPSTFSPDGSISRAEIAALLVRALGWNDNSAVSSFKDVTRSNWFYSAAASSQRHGLINGFSDNTFQGTRAINKEQIMAVAARVLVNKMGYKVPSNPSSYLTRYKDSVADWAQGEVALATKENLVVYRVDGTFKGTGSMTRGDAAIVVYRLFQKIW